MDHDRDNAHQTLARDNQAAAAGMLAMTEKQLGVFVTRSVATGMIRAAADWLFDKIGPREAYGIVQRIADDLAGRAVAKPEQKR